MTSRLTREYVVNALPKRARDSHKGKHGTLTIAAGCKLYRGAAALAADGALRAGAGRVRVASCEEVCAAVASLVPCAIFEPIPVLSARRLTSQSPSAVLAGCGAPDTVDTYIFTEDLLRLTECPLVLDAGALSALASRGPGLLSICGQPVVVTPHIGEMERILRREVTDPEKTAGDFAAQYKCVAVLKGAVTYVGLPNGDMFINDAAGNPGLAKGGTGDVLAGIIAGLLAQGVPPEDAAACGVWLHAAAADEAVKVYGEYGLNASDLPAYVAKLLQSLGL